MLREWFSGKPSGEAAADAGTAAAAGGAAGGAAGAGAGAATGARAVAPVEIDPEVAHRRPTAAEAEAERDEFLRRRLKQAAREGGGGGGPQGPPAYDSLFRGSSKVLLDGHQYELAEGLQLNVARGAGNSLVSTKWQLGAAQASHWDLSLQMNGFNDVAGATFSTNGRWMLMYQRNTTAGAMLVAQFIAQPQAAMMGAGAPGGTFFGLAQYPWVQGGVTALQYVKGQQWQLSHLQRVVRGLSLGACLSYEPMTRSTNVAYGFTSTDARRGLTWAGEVKPESGEWKLALSKADWGLDTEVAVQLELVERRQGKSSVLTFGMRRNLIGGGSFTAVVAGFAKLKAQLEMPFGGERAGMNQLKLAYNVAYDIHTGGFKHGVVFTS